MLSPIAFMFLLTFAHNSETSTLEFVPRSARLTLPSPGDVLRRGLYPTYVSFAHSRLVLKYFKTWGLINNAFTGKLG